MPAFGPKKPRWGAGCAFLDYDRDGRLDLFAANYIDFDLATAPVPESGLCRYKGMPVACGPPGTARRQERALSQHRAAARSRTSRTQSGITRASGTYGLGVSTLDFNDDGWVDLYVANDSNPSALYLNNTDGTFKDVARRGGLRLQPGRQAAGGHGRRPSATTTATARWTSSRPTSPATLRRCTRTTGKGFCEDRTFAAGIGLNTRWLGWGVGFVDLDNDGWLDLFLVNGHVYPEVERLKTEAGYKQRKVVYRNLGNGRFEDVSERLGPPVTTPAAGRGAAFADLDNDGDIDVVVNNVNAAPDLFRLDGPGGRALADAEAGRDAVEPQRDRRTRAAGRRPAATQVQEVRGGGSYYSQNDLRVHFGLGKAASVERVEVRWPNGLEEQWTGLGGRSDRRR